jgi:hypothetical protein
MRVVPEARPFEGDFDRDTLTDVADLAVLGDAWLTDNAYRDVWPRRTGDGIMDFGDFGVVGLHWRQ